MTSREFQLPFAILASCLIAMQTVAVGQLSVVSPGEFATVEAPNVGDVTGVPSYRFQQIYGAADFASLGAGPYTITRIDWRPDGDLTETIDYPSDRFLMRFATTNLDPTVAGDVFDRTFDNNIHGNNQVVFDGAVTMTTANSGPAGGPKAFDYGLDLTTPYIYDPVDGNLLMDLTVVNGKSPLLLDFVFAGTDTSRFHWTGALGADSPVSALPGESGGQLGGHILQFTVEEPIPALTTPFFWDEFDRDTLATNGLVWRGSSISGPGSGTYSIDDGSVVIKPTADDYPGIFVPHTQVEDISVQAQLRFEDSFSSQVNPWVGLWVRDPVDGTGPDDGGYWGGVGANGILYLGKTLRGLSDNEIREQIQLFTPAEVRENDIHYQLDAVGDQISVRAWLDGTEKPDEPQLTMSDSEYKSAVVSGIFVNPFDDLTGFSVRSFALLPALEGDFSASKSLDVDDIDLLSREVLAGGSNRAFDLNGDATVNNLDRDVWVSEVFGTAFGDADLNRDVNFADFLSLAAAFGGSGGWSQGDFDGSGQVDFPDFLLLSENFGAVVAAAAVPEPSCINLTIGLFLGLGSCRVRKRRLATIESAPAPGMLLTSDHGSQTPRASDDTQRFAR